MTYHDTQDALSHALALAVICATVGLLLFAALR